MAIAKEVRHAKAHHRQCQHQVQQMLAAEVHGLGAELAGQLAVSHHRGGEGNGTDESTDEQLDLLHAGVLDTRVEDGGHGDQHRRQAHQRVHGGYQLRHAGHLDGFGLVRANGATGHDGTDNQRQHRLVHDHEGGGHGNQHADDAVAVTLNRRGRRGQAFQCRMNSTAATR